MSVYNNVILDILDSKIIHLSSFSHTVYIPASVAELDAYPTGDQRVAGSTPPGRQHSFVESWSWNIFYGHFLPSADSRRAKRTKECVQ